MVSNVRIAPFMKDEEPESLATCWSLIRRVSSPDCDEDTWSQFFETYRGIVFAIARRSGLTHHEAEDATQETMASVCLNLHKFEPTREKGKFRGWLLTNAKWRIAELIRKRTSLAVAPPVSDERPQNDTEAGLTLDPGSAAFDELWDAQWRAKLLELATQRLRRRSSPAHYQIFDLAVLQELPVQDVARKLGISAGRIYLTKHRMFLQLRRELRELSRKI